ncbi:MAG: T9SS type A sorting domain-containing protein [Bacteroidia bacterium]|nr:T9SS type A sorting domain-containing protein [Bacteroidia bacterium]
MKKLFTFLFVFAFVQLSFGQFSGDYFIGVGQTYTTLKAACDAINAGTVTGNVTFYITSDLTEAANVGLGVNTSGFSITFKPDADVDRTITFTQLSDNSSPTGHFIIGYLGTGLSSAWSDANTIATNNVTIDGYANGGTTKRLIFTNTNASHTNARVVIVVGACENTVIKNCIINNLTTHTGSPFCVGAVVRKGTIIEVGPIGLIIENNTLTALGNVVAMGSRITNSGTLTTVRLTGFVFRNNIVTARRRLLEINYTTGSNIYNNEFTTLQTGVPGTISYGVWTSTGVTGTVNIFNNKFIQSTTEETGAQGHRVISLSSGATYNVYNNMFSGMDKTAASTAALNLTYLFYSGVAGKIYGNTFYMPALTNATSTGYYNCINISGNTAEIINNIFISDEATHTNPSFISAVPIPASNSNNFYMRQSNVNHKVVSTYTTLAAYQSANPTKDVNSKSVNVTFVSATNLHLSGTSLGDVNLIGTPLGAPFDVDIDGEGRHATFPYIGADETDFPLPVELTTFTASVIGSKVKLNWQTATEINNYGFEVERCALSAERQAWENIGFISGNGNSNSQKSYSFMDENISVGKYSYRLKQIDNDGTFEFSSTIEVDLGIPKDFQLSQNYPNPFNPMTKIQYTLPVDAQVTLQIYSITGELMESLVSEYQTSGSYTIDFDGSNFASGTYLYRLVANDFVQTKKMTLVK